MSLLTCTNNSMADFLDKFSHLPDPQLIEIQRNKIYKQTMEIEELKSECKGLRRNYECLSNVQVQQQDNFVKLNNELHRVKSTFSRQIGRKSLIMQKVSDNLADIVKVKDLWNIDKETQTDPVRVTHPVELKS